MPAFPNSDSHSLIYLLKNAVGAVGTLVNGAVSGHYPAGYSNASAITITKDSGTLVVGDILQFSSTSAQYSRLDPVGLAPVYGQVPGDQLNYFAGNPAGIPYVITEVVDGTHIKLDRPLDSPLASGAVITLKSTVDLNAASSAASVSTQMYMRCDQFLCRNIHVINADSATIKIYVSLDGSNWSEIKAEWRLDLVTGDGGVTVGPTGIYKLPDGPIGYIKAVRDTATAGVVTVLMQSATWLF